MKKWIVIENKNIADLIIEVYGSSKKSLLKNVLLAFSSLITDVKRLKNIVKMKGLEITGESLEERIFHFVEKLIYFKDTQFLLFKKGEFKILEDKIIANLSGQKITPLLPVKVDIKALTRHKFNLKEEKGYYKLVMVFDV